MSESLSILILWASGDWVLLDMDYDKIAHGKDSKADLPLSVAKNRGYAVEEIYFGVPRFQHDCFKRFMRAEHVKLKILGEGVE